MKELIVKRLRPKKDAMPEDVRKIMERGIPPVAIDTLKWTKFSYCPSVHFRIAHTGEALWLSFDAEESHVLARHLSTNSATHKDSCVEFFIDPKKDGNYYNFEWNAIGTVHLAYGPNVREREFIDPEIIESRIRSYSSLGTQPLDMRKKTKWNLTVIIPVDILIHDPILDLSGVQANANFFKCGDETEKPHFLSWNPVLTDQPNFHQPLYFGRLIFE